MTTAGMELDVVKNKHGAGGYRLQLVKGNGNTKFGDAKKKAIIEALQDSWTEGVYITSHGILIRQLLNGTIEKL